MTTILNSRKHAHVVGNEVSLGWVGKGDRDLTGGQSVPLPDIRELGLVMEHPTSSARKSINMRGVTLSWAVPAIYPIYPPLRRIEATATGALIRGSTHTRSL